MNTHLRSIRVFLKYCVDEQYIRYDLNTCLRVKWIKERQVAIQTFNDEEIKEILAVAKKKTFFEVKRMDKNRIGFQMKFTNQRTYLLLLLLIDTGMRINELVNLKIEHLNESEIFIEKSKGKKDRVVHCSPLVCKEYLKY